MLKIAVLISGGGSNLQSIIDNINSGYLKNCTIEYVISDRENAYGIKRAKENNIKTMVFDRKKYSKALSDEILKVLKDKVNLIVLAGFTSILNKSFIESFKNKIINIHPSLIPNFCGNGMYGIKVHEAAINYGVKVSGCTVHFVDEGTDTGAIILQKTVSVYGEDSPEGLQKRVLIEEHKALPEAIKLISEDKIKIKGRLVYIKE
ncbi:phosphoribosylglycinamide formyltransferase [Clostridium argentinense CDC 2741]|uniref:Phosphoribosylglycinamide formyltransferase n=1 Tax=Clostridium argentinense CDC 2741 TaxID=1418104 RepID=A0A0C1R6Z4_9CLOT|nr:phosphoribosylglycinamide formyltransferase [Clostridium argentinense]ARC85843.1 phosphoribosylglycinamide formyltransferase [Clostridium argentinense]KIE46261.1 phosphoribosylglycinamide formyltransferase [Clostridium argentinense CDC 2741]NFF39928.1 phosphoribosylglycinamide formyltransferase [Clostridium argentinense]NFP48559.1 phosphoribosylglycinamide formyltransferase [Clostridium argentinense]NFP71173.1 phosphoribosylglycinamide formyltransferase [Clostridium argentinense]